MESPRQLRAKSFRVRFQIPAFAVADLSIHLQRRVVRPRAGGADSFRAEAWLSHLSELRSEQSHANRIHYDTSRLMVRVLTCLRACLSYSTRVRQAFRTVVRVPGQIDHRCR